MKSEEEISEIIEQLFRRESGKLVAVLTRIFGPENMELAEDVVQDAIIEAIDHWNKNGVPENPPAWLQQVAKNKALNVIHREKYKRQYTTDVLHLLKSPWTVEPVTEILFSDREVEDDQLRMIFTCCHPAISSDSQIALILKILCGFSTVEISKAFLTTPDNIHKRLVRAREKIRNAHIPFEVPTGEQLQARTKVVLEAIYLLFNEGYNATKGKELVRFGLCAEAMRLTSLLTRHNAISDKSTAYALLALMQLNASRFNSRQDKNGNILTLEQQDRRIWSKELIAKGLVSLERAAFNEETSIYHILASISAYHCIAKDYKQTNWKSILKLYDQLTKIDNRPIILLNRAIALSKVKGPDKAIDELEKLRHNNSINSYHLFHCTLAELYMQTAHYDNAKNSLKLAIELTAHQAEKDLLKNRLKQYSKKNYRN